MQGAMVQDTEYIVPKKACRTCGSRLRYKSNGNCVQCKRDRDALRIGDRQSHRRRCEAMLRAMGHNLNGKSRQEKDYLIAATFPLMQAYLRDVLKVQWWLVE